MTFDNIDEARKWFLSYKPFKKEWPNFWVNYPFKNWKFGDWILIQHIKNPENKKDTSVISRPILAVFTGFKIWDQALVINYVQRPRAWMYCHEIITNASLNISMPIFSLDDEIEAIQFWTDDIKVLGHWKNKPTLSELKKSLLFDEF